MTPVIIVAILGSIPIAAMGSSDHIWTAISHAFIFGTTLMAWLNARQAKRNTE